MVGRIAEVAAKNASFLAPGGPTYRPHAPLFSYGFFMAVLFTYKLYNSGHIFKPFFRDHHHFRTGLLYLDLGSTFEHGGRFPTLLVLELKMHAEKVGIIFPVIHGKTLKP